MRCLVESCALFLISLRLIAIPLCGLVKLRGQKRAEIFHGIQLPRWVLAVARIHLTAGEDREHPLNFRVNNHRWCSAH